MKRSFPIQVWSLFALFTLVNGLVTFAPLSSGWKLTVILLGLALPLGWALFRKEPQDKAAFAADLFPGLPVWTLAGLGVVALFLRFHHLTSLSVWPLEDEAMNGHYALEFAEKGNWQFTYDFSGMPPLYIWGLGVFFKLFGASLFSLWLFPALLSTGALGLAYAGSRKIFPSSFALVFSSLLAFSFWPLYVGRFSLQGGALYFWECLTFYLLAVFWERLDRGKTAGKKRSEWAALVLGLGSGLGFYSFTSWAVVAFLLTLLVFSITVLRSKDRWGLFLTFFAPQVLLFLPLALVTATQRGGHFQYVLQNPFAHYWTGLNDLRSIFWGSPLTPNLFAYRPFWGGFLDPLLGGLFFYGTFFWVRSHRWFDLLKAFSVFFILLLPGFLTGGLDAHRVVQSMPFFLLLAAFGLTSLLASLDKSRRVLCLAVVLVLTAGLDHHHLFGVYHRLWTQPDENVEVYKPFERGRAYLILKDLAKKEGPGFVLSDLVPDIFDQSLSVAAYPFNAAQNPRLDPAAARWAALFTNVHYQPALEKQFPGARGFWLASDLGRPDGGFLLEVIPLPCAHPEAFERILRADQAMADLVGPSYDNHDWKPRGPIVEALIQKFPHFKGDPFLESCFWEKIAQNEYMDHHFMAQTTALEQALKRGIPAAHLYNDLGALYFRHNRLAQARKAFQTALGSVPNHTSAKTGLEMLGELEKTGQKPKD